MLTKKITSPSVTRDGRDLDVDDSTQPFLKGNSVSDLRVHASIAGAEGGKREMV